MFTQSITSIQSLELLTIAGACHDVRASLLVKPGEHGNTVDAAKVKKIIINNGVPVNKVMVSSTGDKFINLPDQKRREKLQPMLE